MVIFALLLFVLNYS